MVHNSALWFIPCLFAVETMYFFVSRLGDAKSLLASFCIAAIGVILAQCFGKKYLMTMPWNLDAAFYALPFYCVADVFKRKMPPAAFAKAVDGNRFGMTGLLVVLIAVLCVLAFRFGECSMGSSSYNCNIGIFMLRAFVGTFALILLAVLAGRLCDNVALRWLSDGIKWCGRNSIHIMCTHIPVKGVAALGIAKMWHANGGVSESYLFALAVLCVTMVVVWMVVWTIGVVKRSAMRNLSNSRIPA